MPLGTDFIADVGIPSEHVVISLGVPAGVGDNVGEFINVLEFVEVRISSGVAISVFDDDAATEVVLVVVNPLTVVVSETDLPTEAVELDYPNLEVVVFEGAAPAEHVAVVVNPLRMDVADVDMPAEGVQVVILLGIAVFDDNTFPPLEPPPMPMTGIARDYVDVQEGLGMGLGIPVVAGDAVTVGEAVAIALPLPVLAVDQLAPLDVIDATFVTIQPLFATVSDDVGPQDAATVVRTVVVVVADGLSSEDVAAAALLLAVVVGDAGAPAEAVALKSSLAVLAIDTVPVNDQAQGEFDLLLCGVGDTIAVGEALVGSIPLGVIVQDAGVAAELLVVERAFVSTRFLIDIKMIRDAVGVASVDGEAVRVR